jgi:hypothetical protein
MELGAKLQIRDGHSVAVLGLPADVAFSLPGGAQRRDEPAQADVVIAFVRDSAALAGPPAAAALTAAREGRLAWLATSGPRCGSARPDRVRPARDAATYGSRSIR